jgi:transposase
MSETVSQRRSVRRPLDLEQLQSDPTSLLAFGADDPVLRKLETRRLHEAGYAAEDIAQAFGFSRPYLYEMWAKLAADGVAALDDKRWGSAPRTRTPECEAQVLRAKALAPQRRDSDLAAEFKLDRSTVYRLLKEHGLQDLHRVLTAAPAPDSASDTPAMSFAPSAGETSTKKGPSKSSPAPRP